MCSVNDGVMCQEKGKTARGSGGFVELLVWCAALAVVALLPFVGMWSVRFGFPSLSAFGFCFVFGFSLCCDAGEALVIRRRGRRTTRRRSREGRDQNSTGGGCGG